MFRVAPNSLVCATLLFHSSPHARIRRRRLTHRSELIELYGNRVYPLQTVSPREIYTLHNIFVITVGCALSQTRTNCDSKKVHTCIYRCVGRVQSEIATLRRVLVLLVVQINHNFRVGPSQECRSLYCSFPLYQTVLRCQAPFPTLLATGIRGLRRDHT